MVGSLLSLLHYHTLPIFVHVSLESTLPSWLTPGTSSQTWTIDLRNPAVFCKTRPAHVQTITNMYSLYSIHGIHTSVYIVYIYMCITHITVYMHRYRRLQEKIVVQCCSSNKVRLGLWKPVPSTRSDATQQLEIAKGFLAPRAKLGIHSTSSQYLMNRKHQLQEGVKGI